MNYERLTFDELKSFVYATECPTAAATLAQWAVDAHDGFKEMEAERDEAFTEANEAERERDKYADLLDALVVDLKLLHDTIDNAPADSQDPESVSAHLDSLISHYGGML